MEQSDYIDHVSQIFIGSQEVRINAQYSAGIAKPKGQYGQPICSSQ